MKSYIAKPADIKRDWYVVDVAGKTVGRVATEIASRLIVINAAKVTLTGNKAEKKVYHHHTGFPGGIVDQTFNELIQRHPEMVIESAVKGMLPKGPLGRAMFRKLKVYAGAEHNHAAQQPKVLDI